MIRILDWSYLYQAHHDHQRTGSLRNLYHRPMLVQMEEIQMQDRATQRQAHPSSIDNCEQDESVEINQDYEVGGMTTR